LKIVFFCAGVAFLQTLKHEHHNLYAVIASVMVVAWWCGWSKIFDIYVPENMFWLLVVVPFLFFYLDDFSLNELFSIDH
jgi:hypothetical protein